MYKNESGNQVFCVKRLQRRNLLVSSILILFVLASLVSIQPSAAASPPNLGVSSSTQTLIVGANNGVRITITNYGDTPANQIFVSLSLPSSPTGGALMILSGSDGKWYIDALDSGNSTSIYLNINVISAAAGNDYQLVFTLNYLVNSTTANSTNTKVDTRTIGVNVPLLQTNGAYLTTNFTTSQLVAGQNNTLNLTVTNTGDATAYGVQVSLTMPGAAAGTSTLSLMNGDGKWVFNSIAPNTNFSIPLTIFATMSSSGQNYQIPISLTYTDYIKTKADVHYLPLSVPTAFGPSAAIGLKLSSGELKAGVINNITMTVTNNGDGTADATTIVLTMPGVQGGASTLTLVGSDGTYVLGSLAPGATKLIPLRIFVSPAASGTLTSLTATTSYTDMGYKPKQQVNYLGLVLRGNVNLVILDTSTYPSNVTLDNSFTLTVSMINLGTVTAQSVIIYPNGTGGIQPLSSEKVFLGDLAVNVPSSFTIPFIPSNVTSGTYNLTMAYSYKDSLGGTFTDYLNIPFTLTVVNASSSSGQTTGGGILATLMVLLPWIIIAIVIVIVLYFIWRRRKSRSI